MITVLLYLNDIPEGGGGETSFPLAESSEAYAKAFHKFSECQGIKVRPKKGSAAVFYSLTGDYPVQDGELDMYSLHGGCNVLASENWGDEAPNKWLSNFWFYNRALRASEGETDTFVPMAKK